jgi:hypothetical protein
MMSISRLAIQHIYAFSTFEAKPLFCIALFLVMSIGIINGTDRIVEHLGTHLVVNLNGVVRLDDSDISRVQFTNVLTGLGPRSFTFICTRFLRQEESHGSTINRIAHYDTHVARACLRRL